MLFKTEGGKVHTGTENSGLCENADSTHTINLHLHVWVTIWVAEIGQMGPPCCVLGIPFDNDCILVKCIRKSKRGL